ncbi:methylaspartate ammonia-lyase [Modestobacter sp. DSM 44400]|uniref:methylaspartate ammonia-lyase n=1 Tax=Modestobacter sp. DSM 44400 TaxID=1550230 RepID=UPI00089D930D|nr:methylaspartate ammonia-lyase [Modestobacter sp. DSM 44400]SDY13071.1 methylaspartate ammonia-lyase [Modestobacter sp. DSM 44400]
MPALRIAEVLPVPVRGGFFADDQAAIRAGAQHDGFGYVGSPLTPGFTAVRQPGEALSVVLVLDDGSVEFGDCAAVQYSGAGGRDPVFSAEQAADDVRFHLAPRLVGVELDSFRNLTGALDRVCTDAGPLHTAVRYGVSQAVLAAVARAARVTMAEVVRDEYRTGAPLLPVPLYAQTGDDRYVNADKMILKGVDVLPHGLFNSPAVLGPAGRGLEEYLRWLVARIGQLRPDGDHRPRLHVDTYGTPGLAFGGDVAAVAAYLARLGDLCAPFELAVEHPIDAGGRDAQIEAYVRLRAELARLGSGVRVVVDEWCNTLDDVRAFVAAAAADVVHVKTPDLGSLTDTVEALLLVRDAGLEAYCGGTCNETDRSAQVSAHIAMACEASQVLAKPGMGVDEGLMIVGNEMARTAALVAARRTPVPAARPEPDDDRRTR